MKRLLTKAVLPALLVVLVCAPEASALGRRKNHCPPPCPPPCPPAPATCVQWVEKHVPSYRLEWRTREVSHVVQKAHYVTRTKTVRQTVLKPYWVKQKLTRTVYRPVWETVSYKSCSYRPVTREVEQTVCSYQMVPQTCVDPCTGCSYTVCRPVPCVRKVPTTVVEYVPVTETRKARVCRYRPSEETYTARVCKYREETQNVRVNYVECQWKPERVVTTQHYCVRVPCTVTVKVPVHVPCAPVH